MSNTILAQENWTHQARCVWCSQTFTMNTQNVVYQPLPNSVLLVPDYQFMVTCPECSGMNIVTSIPSAVANYLQTK